MTDNNSKTGFFQELKRRNVFRLGVAYVIGAWLIAQIADLVLDNIEAPDWVIQVLFLILAIGFVIALVISWAYEVTPEGIKLERDVIRDESITHVTAKKLDYVTVAAALGVAGIFLWQQFGTEPANRSVTDTESAQLSDTPAAPTEGQPSIAVLPFADLSPEGDQEYFSDGIAEEILNALVGVEGIEVASRTSSFAFKGQETLGIPVIARELNVRHVLEGSVRKAGESIRITAQLVDAQSDKHLWSETFDRNLSVENIFAIQDEIASAIVKSLGAAIGVGNRRSKLEADTTNLDAYELYLEAYSLFLSRGQENIRRSMDLFEQVTRLDANFARAWGGLSAVYGIAPGWGIVDRDYLSLAETSAQKAIELNPDLSLPYAVLGQISHQGLPFDWERAIEMLDRAVANNPSNTTALLFRGISLQYSGYFDKATENLKTCLTIDPDYVNCRRWLVTNLIYQGKKNEALIEWNRVLVSGFPEWNVRLAWSILPEDQSDARLLALTNFIQVYLGNGGRWAVRPLHQAMSDPTFDREAGLLLFEARLQSYFGSDPRMSGRLGANIYLYLFGAFEHIQPYILAFHWDKRIDPKNRRRLIIESNLPAYWRKHGFPSRCRPLGDDDFECD